MGPFSFGGALCEDGPIEGKTVPLRGFGGRPGYGDASELFAALVRVAR
jgi:hypothetical protein